MLVTSTESSTGPPTIKVTSRGVCEVIADKDGVAGMILGEEHGRSDITPGELVSDVCVCVKVTGKNLTDENILKTRVLCEAATHTSIKYNH